MIDTTKVQRPTQYRFKYGFMDSRLRVDGGYSCGRPQIANFIKNEKPHLPVYCFKDLLACLAVTNFDLNYIKIGRIEWAEIFNQQSCLKKNFLGEGPKTIKVSKSLLVWLPELFLFAHFCLSFAPKTVTFGLNRQYFYLVF